MAFDIRILGIATICLVTSLHSTPARSAPQEIVLVSDQSLLVRLAQPPSTVIIGNPAVADVTTDGSSLYFHPRGFGLTNVIVLDADGKRLGDYLLRVIFEDSYSVSMYSPDGRQTYSCRRDCEPMMRIGDNPTFFSSYSQQVSQKNGLASAQPTGDNVQTSPSTTIVTTSAPISGTSP